MPNYNWYTRSLKYNHPYSASRGALGGMSLTWTPPRFFSWLSGMGSAHPPSPSGVASHNLKR